MSKSFVKKDEKEKNIFGILAIVVPIIIIGAFLVIVSKNNASKSIVPNHIKEVSYKEYQEKIMEDKYTIVFLGRPSCGHCVEYKPLVNQIAEKYDLEVYYLNVSIGNITEDEYDELHDSISVLKNQFDEEGYPVIPTPTTVIFKGGVEVASELGNIRDDGLEELLVQNNVITKK